MIYGSVELLQRKTKATIPGISLYNNFRFEDDNIFAWRAYKIGTGVPISNNQWTDKHNVPILKVIKVLTNDERESEPQQCDQQ